MPPMAAMITDSQRTDSAQLAPGHPDRAQHPDLVGALVDRERQGVHDAEDRDRLRQEQQGDEHAEELVDQPRSRRRAPRPG